MRTSIAIRTFLEAVKFVNTIFKQFGNPLESRVSKHLHFKVK